MSGFAALVLREWVSAPLVFLVAMAPGAGFAVVLARRLRFSGALAAALSFALPIAWTSIVATVAYAAGFSLDFVVVCYLLPLPPSLWLLVTSWRRGTLRGPAGDRPAFVLAAGAALVAAIERPWFTAGADSLYHMAATRSLLATGRPLVTDPFFGTSSRTLDPTSGVWHTVQAVMSRVLATDISTLYLGITALGAAAVVLCFWVLARQVSDSRASATIATLAMMAVAYHFDFRVLAYPKHLSEALAFLALALFVYLLEHPREPAAVLSAVVVGVAAFTTHVATAEFLLLAGLTMLVWLFAAQVAERVRKGGLSWGAEIRVLVLVLVLVAGSSLPVILPRAGVLASSGDIGSETMAWIGTQVTTLFGLQFVRPGGMYNGGLLLFLATVALLVAAARTAFRDHDPRALASAALLSMNPLFLADPLVTPWALRFSGYMTSRIAALLRFAPFVGSAWGLPAGKPSRRTVTGWLAIAVIVVALLSAVPDLAWTVTGRDVLGFPRGLDVYGLGTTWQSDIRQEWGPEDLERLRTLFGNDYPVVAAEPDTGYYLCGVVPCAVVAGKLAHTPFAIEQVSGPERRADMLRFFDPSASISLRRQLVARWRIRYVAIWHGHTDPRAETSMLSQTELFGPVVTGGSLEVLKVLDSAPVR